MKRMKRIALIVTAAMLLTSSGAFACTGAYVGRNVSKEGTTLIAKSEDQTNDVYPKMFKVQERITKKGRYFKDTGTGFKVKLPKTTYKYTYVPDSTDCNDGLYPAACTNEYGLSVVGTITTGVSDEYAKIDPCTKYNQGLREAILPALIAGQARTAKGACKVLAKLIDKYGSAEYNTLLFADKKGAWIFEIYGGHSYCAMKLNPNKVSVFGNHIMIGWVNSKTESKNYLFSKKLFKNLKKVSTVVRDGSKFNIARSIDDVEDGARYPSSNLRDWGGMVFLAGKDAAGEYSDDKFYPLQYEPKDKVSVLDVMNLYRYRYEGTDYDTNNPENATKRAISYTEQSDISIMQVYGKLPKESNTVQWLAMGDADSSVFVPAFSGITDTHKAYKVDGTAFNLDSAWWMFKRNATLMQADQKHLRAGTKAFWRTQEKAELKEIQKATKKVKKEYKKSTSDGREYVTQLGKDMAQKQMNNSDVLNSALQVISPECTGYASKVLPDYVPTFKKPVNLVKTAKKQGFKVKIKGKKINLTKKKVKYTLVLNSREYRKKGKLKGNMTYPVYKSHGILWAPANFADYLK